MQQEEEEMLVPHSDLVEGPQPMEGFTLHIHIHSRPKFHQVLRILLIF
jgi:hypothetical protein